MNSTSKVDDLPGSAWLVALSCLPGAGPRRLCSLLDLGTPREVWDLVAHGHRSVQEIAGSHKRVAAWRAAAAAADIGNLWDAHVQAGLGVVGRSSPAFPSKLANDSEPPAVLFVDGDLGHVHPLAVAVVGTRRCTRYGTDLAFELGAMLSQAGVTVVSGLALGIDAAAHAGALQGGGAPPVAVVANDLSTPYPRQNAALWRQVAAMGAVLSEAPLGTKLERWRFPARNRLVAALSLLTVVVESDATGGSMYTAAEAVRRGRQVLAVPGPIRSPSSAGTNALLADGHHPVCDLSDVLVAVGLAADSVAHDQPPLESVYEAVLDAFCWQPVTIEVLLERLEEPLGVVASHVEKLKGLGLVAQRGRWLERTVALV